MESVHAVLHDMPLVREAAVCLQEMEDLYCLVDARGLRRLSALVLCHHQDKEDWEQAVHDYKERRPRVQASFTICPR